MTAIQIALRRLADYLIQLAAERPKDSLGGAHLRDAATALLDAETAIEREDPQT